MRKGSTFASKTVKSPMPKPLTADIEVGEKVEFGVGAQYLKHVRGSMPASQGLTWAQGERKPPHFHVPFRAYPSAGGTPRGRSKGLDEFYDLDHSFASPLALHSTLAVNMHRTSRVYASTFKSRLPARPQPDSSGGSGALGPGSYTVDRIHSSGIQLKEPKRASSAFARESRGRYHNVGGPKGDGGLWAEQRKVPREEW